MLDYELILEAQDRIRKRVRHTELISSNHFSQQLGYPLLLKCENLQTTGAFKLRGAMNFMTAHERSELAQGVTAASAGNHAQGVAYAADLLGIPAKIFMPQTTPPQKVQATRDLGAEVVLTGANFDESFAAAQTDSLQSGTVFIHPFDDPLVMAGQGTIGLEILKDLPDVANIVVPIGGGGLLAGIAVAIKELNPRVRIIGVETASAPCMYRAVQDNCITDVPLSVTIADGIAVKKAGQLAMPIIRDLVDELVLVEEEEIALAIVALLEKSKLLVEGAGAVALAALLNNKVAHVRGKTVCLLSGGNIDVRTLALVVERGLLAAGRYLKLRIEMQDTPGALANLATDLAFTRANIHDITHDRRTKGLVMGTTAVQLVLETRGQDHAQQVLALLAKRGYSVTTEQ
ncbi:MAG: threonine ammonia-lyase [Trichlorobacter sp.]|uniref:threonine ammonia-lyase n=1 Tax=Trichlorobacter sp. TaxID=2911007 RepID=UPI0025624A08|nr:threonine ammonia-lyase [Trichlorobacter sp.]MDK9718275.1 threonine ammonia-lyase [Trichlorobacter sp.]